MIADTQAALQARETEDWGPARAAAPLRPLFIWGFTGAGKTTVGRRVASAVGAPLIDLDARIEAEAARPVARIFAEEGELGFRRREAGCLGALLAELEVAGSVSGHGPPPVVALGGGAALERKTRDAIDRVGMLLCLNVRAETAAARLASANDRPLLPEGALRRHAIETQWSHRAAAYASVENQVMADEGSPEALAEEIVRRWRLDQTRKY